MAEASTSRRSHKEWRRIAKKERRRRLRREAAAERDADAERLRAALEKSADYLNWLELCEKEDREREAREKVEHDDREKLWLEEEERAQKEWQILQEKKLKARQQQLEQEEKIRKEFEVKQEAIRRKQEEEKRKREEDIRRHEQLLKEIDDYIDNGVKTPESLREVIDSQPGKELCPFFTKTAACRYGDTCSRNHRRVCLSKVILVPGFYSHFSLEKNTAEYDTDVALEFESSETRQHFREFYKDVVPELESFGRIKTLKYCCNTEVHLRGNLYVEYYTERDAARAVRNLKGRWYAGRQLNCEFASLNSWRSAVCGMTKCPKGRACNFLHTFKNPHDEYGIKSPPRWAKQTGSGHDTSSSRRTEHRSKSNWEELLSNHAEDKRNWRWSESPEIEVEHRSRNSEKRRGRRRRRSGEREHRKSSSRDERHERIGRCKTSEVDSSTKRRSSSRKLPGERSRGDEVANGGESSSSRSKRLRRSNEEEIGRVGAKSSKSDCSKSCSERRHRARNERPSESDSRRKRDEPRERNYTEQREDRSSRRTSSGNSEGSLVENAKTVSNVSRAKTKWDKEESGGSSSESVHTFDSDSSDSLEDKVKANESERRWKNLEDEWATTDSENEATNRER